MSSLLLPNKQLATSRDSAKNKIRNEYAVYADIMVNLHSYEYSHVRDLHYHYTIFNTSHLEVKNRSNAVGKKS